MEAFKPPLTIEIALFLGALAFAASGKSDEAHLDGELEQMARELLARRRARARA